MNSFFAMSDSSKNIYPDPFNSFNLTGGSDIGCERCDIHYAHTTSARWVINGRIGGAAETNPLS